MKDREVRRSTGGIDVLDSKVDLTFKRLFDKKESENLLMSFINSIVDDEDKIKGITLNNPYIKKQIKDDELSVLTLEVHSVNTNRWYTIDIQISNQEYYDERSLYKWSKVYIDDLTNQADYSKIEKKICINILNFNYNDVEKDFHNAYKLHYVKNKNVFIDDLEIHFIELTKECNDIKNLLDEWVLFLEKENLFKELPKESEEVEIKDKRIEIAKNLLDILEPEMIASKTGLSIEEVEELLN